MNAEERRSQLEQRFDRSVLSWDRHIDACGECLVQGSHLCTEGLYLSSDVISARASLEAFELRQLSRESLPREVTVAPLAEVGA
jgi:hypothetical protein